MRASILETTTCVLAQELNYTCGGASMRSNNEQMKLRPRGRPVGDT